MEDLPWPSRRPRDGVTIPVFWLAIALSVLVHLGALWAWIPRLKIMLAEQRDKSDSRGSLVVQLAPPAPPAPGATGGVASPQSAPSRVERGPVAAVRPAPSQPAKPVVPAPRSAPLPPPVMAVEPQAAPLPQVPAPAQATAPEPAPPAPATAPSRAGDFAGQIEARRRMRGEAPPSQPAVAPAQDGAPSPDRIIAANLGLDRTPTFGREPAPGGGMFQIKRMGYSDAEFLFFGWNRDIRRNTSQIIEVAKGANSDMRVAVVRRMIAIIREHSAGDFLWESRRLGRDVTLSARPADNTGLEEFLLMEFFPESRAAR